MEVDSQAQAAFFLTGRRPSGHLDAVEGLGLRPAFFARYRDLTRLRYDFPVVLVPDCADANSVQPVSAVVDAALAAAAQGVDAERVRKHALRVEQEIRTLVAGGATGTLAELWGKAVARVAKHMAKSGADKAFEDSARRVRAALGAAGEVIDCDARLPVRLAQHAWAAVQQQKTDAFRKHLDRLLLALSDIFRADSERSAARRSARQLKDSASAGLGRAFDFDAMSRRLSEALPREAFPESRCQRIRDLLNVLKSQQFFATPGAVARKAGHKPYVFRFDNCGDALAACRERMPKLVGLAKAIAVAELEIDGQYDEARHDALFEQFGANGLDPQDFAPYPDYLVCVNAGRMQAEEHAQLMEILSSGLPIKVLLQVDDILGDAASGGASLSVGLRSRQIASMAMGLNEAYVLQSASSNLCHYRERMLRGLAYQGPALFSVYSGANAQASDLPPYLMAAAAMESRAFPAFTYDPSAGANWASRFDLRANAQVEADWPIHGFAYENEAHQRVTEDLAFTFVDFVASDRRYASHLARVPREQWTSGMISVDEALRCERRGLPDKVPSLLMVDEADRLQKVIAGGHLIREARRCRAMWRSLQELGGVHNSHAEVRLAHERVAWEERMREAAAAAAAAVLAAAAPAQKPQRNR